jgi:hypothetical protein
VAAEVAEYKVWEKVVFMCAEIVARGARDISDKWEGAFL